MSFLLRSGTKVKDAALDRFTLDLGEPQFNLVKPGRVGRREVHMDGWMLTQECINLLCLVRREVVCNDVNLLAAGLIGQDVGQEGHELGRGVCRVAVLPSTLPVLILKAA